MSDFHPETWSPSWNISSVLVGLVSFMTTDELTTGCEKKSDEERRKLASQSFEYNMNTPMFVNLFKEYFSKFEESKESLSKATLNKAEKKAQVVENEQGGAPQRPVENGNQNNNPSIASYIFIVIVLLVIFKALS